MKSHSPVITAFAILAALASPGGWALEIVIQNTQPLSFGSFAAGSGGSVTVGTSGTRTAAGDVFLMPSSEGQPAQFTVTGDANATYTIELPPSDFVKLTGPGSDMVISDFTSAPSGVSGQLGAGGSQNLSVGGTLNVNAGQAPGDYAGSFTVTVTYN